MTCHLLDALVAVGIRNQVPFNRGVLVLALTAIKVPRVPNHKLEVVVLIDAGGNVTVVFDELSNGDLVVTHVSVPLGHELAEDIVAALLTGLELRVLSHVVGDGDVIKVDHAGAVAIKLLVGQLDESNSALVHIAADADEEFIVAHLAVVVLVEVLEDALELRRAEGVAILSETPHELVAVHLAVTVVVHAAENNSEATDAVSATALQGVKNLLKHLIRGLALNTEDWVDVGVVAATTDGEPARELLVVELGVTVLVVLVEDSTALELRESAAHRLECAAELTEADSVHAIKVEMLKDLANGLALVVCTVGALPDLLEDDILELSEAGGVDGDGCALHAPGLQKSDDEVAILVDGGYSVAISIEAHEGLLSDVAASGLFAHKLNEIVHDSLSALFARRDTGMRWGIELSNKGFKRDAWGALCQLLPCLLDDGNAILAHISLKTLTNKVETRVSFRKLLLERLKIKSPGLTRRTLTNSE